MFSYVLDCFIIIFRIHKYRKELCNMALKLYFKIKNIYFCVNKPRILLFNKLNVMKKLLGVLFFCAVLLAGCSESSLLFLYDLRCENLANPTAIDSDCPHFSWKLASDKPGTFQTHYEIRMAGSADALRGNKCDYWSSGKVASDASVMIPYAGKELASRTVAYWQVRVLDNHGRVSAWSDVQRFGIGILEAKAWQGAYIGLKDCPSPQLRKTFEVADHTLTRMLHVASLGYHEVYVNGQKVTDDVLAPSVSQLDKTVNSVTYDITPFIRQGKNDLVIWLGTGWYREQTFKAVHQGPLVKAELDVLKDGEATVEVATDATWKARASEYSDASNGWWYPHQFGGECVDGHLVLADIQTDTLDVQSWHPAWVAEVPDLKISPQMCEPNRVIEVIQPEEIRQVADSTWVVKLPKAMNGWVEIDFPALPDSLKVTIEYSDKHDGKGNFMAQEEYATGKHSPHYEDAYIAKGAGEEVFRNKFNHHGFQYIRLSHLPQAPEQVTAYLVGTDFKDASSFESSDADMNAIYSMIKYTFRPLAFSGYIVDCPQLERMGYGGDGNASCRTFQTLYDGAPLYQNWMKMWADCIREDGGMPHCVPNPYSAGGGPYWCGFIITASWETYLNFGDKRLLERYYPVMKQWLGYVNKYTVDGLLKRWPDTEYRSWYLGDWLAPEGVDYKNLESVDLVSNCFVSYCYEVMSNIATLMGNEDDATLYKNKEQALKELVHRTFYKEDVNKYASGSQIDLIYPMLVEVAKGEVAEQVRKELMASTEQRDGHIGVGLVGVTILTDWATRNGEVDFLFQMLKKPDYPGYLYMINQGATTTWEEWKTPRSKIHNCFNGIGSWFIQALGGIQPTWDAPGYKEILIRPQLPEGMEWVKVSKETPYGEVCSSWKVEADSVVFSLRIPANASARFVCPFEAKECLLNGVPTAFEEGALALQSGDYEIVLKR